MVALKLSKAGYGRPEEIMAMRADIVKLALEYEAFVRDYEAAFLELNRSESGNSR